MGLESSTDEAGRRSVSEETSGVEAIMSSLFRALRMRDIRFSKRGKTSIALDFNFGRADCREIARVAKSMLSSAKRGLTFKTDTRNVSFSSWFIQDCKTCLNIRF